jgi:hypothetical protein
MWGEDNINLFDETKRYTILACGHCFYYHDGIFYDSEAPEGVESPDDLPFYNRLRKKAEIRMDFEYQKVSNSHLIVPSRKDSYSYSHKNKGMSKKQRRGSW